MESDQQNNGGAQYGAQDTVVSGEEQVSTNGIDDKHGYMQEQVEIAIEKSREPLKALTAKYSRYAEEIVRKEILWFIIKKPVFNIAELYNISQLMDWGLNEYRQLLHFQAILEENTRSYESIRIRLMAAIEEHLLHIVGNVITWACVLKYSFDTSIFTPPVYPADFPVSDTLINQN